MGLLGYVMVEKGHISVKGVEMDSFLEVKSVAARNRKKMGDVVTQALKMWLDDYREKEGKQQSLV